MPVSSSSVTCEGCGTTYDGLPVSEASAGSEGYESEKDVERRLIQLYEALGCEVWKTSQPRAATGMTEGLPDLIVLKSRCGLEVPACWFHEVKPTDDEEEARRKQRDSQRTFEAASERSGVAYLLGGVEVARGFLGLD